MAWGTATRSLVAAALGLAAVLLHGCGKSNKPETKPSPFSLDAVIRSKYEGDDYTMTCEGPWDDLAAWESNATMDGVKIVLATTVCQLKDTWAEALPKPFKGHEVVVDEGKIVATAAANPKELGDAMAALSVALKKKGRDLRKSGESKITPLPFSLDAWKREGNDYTMTCEGPWEDWAAWKKNATMDGVKIVLATTVQELKDAWAEALPEPFKGHEVVVDEGKIVATAAANPKELRDAMAALGVVLENKEPQAEPVDLANLLELPDRAPVAAGRRSAGGQGFLAASG